MAISFIDDFFATVKLTLLSYKIRKNSIFNEDYYFRTNPDLTIGKINAAKHFLTNGWKEGRNPSIDFDIQFYTDEYADVRSSGVNPLLHFMKHGHNEQRLTNKFMKDIQTVKHSKLFDTNYYTEQQGGEYRSETKCITHYFTKGWKNGLNPSPDFDTQFYLNEYPDVKGSNTNPLLHYVVHGADEDRVTNQIMKDRKFIARSNQFDSDYYMEQRRGCTTQTDCIGHYCIEGWKNGLNPNPSFETTNYLENNPHLLQIGSNPFVHYLKEEELRELRHRRILSKISKNDNGLEIGPSHNPSAPRSKGYNCEVLDHLSRDGLLRKYKKHKVNLERIEEVDHVWNGGSYVSLINKTDHYDYIIASHVIEHTTYLLSFLIDCHELLRAEGILSIAVPDKRYCFDHFNPVTFVGKVIDDYLQKKALHSPGSIADHFLNVVRKNDLIVWHPGTGGEYEFIHNLEFVKSKLNGALEHEEYNDIHEYKFTPDSFRLLLNDLGAFGFINFEISSCKSNGSEFFVVLTKKTSNPDVKQRRRIELLKRINIE